MGARIFLSFYGLLDLQHSAQAFDSELDDCVAVIRDQRGLASTTVETRTQLVRIAIERYFREWLRDPSIYVIGL
jgi:hypothetical protein